MMIKSNFTFVIFFVLATTSVLSIFNVYNIWGIDIVGKTLEEEQERILNAPFFDTISQEPPSRSNNNGNRRESSRSSPKIAFLRSHVKSNRTHGKSVGGKRTSIPHMLDHITNQECYCHLWNYDCIFNQTQDLIQYSNSNHQEQNTFLREQRVMEEESATSKERWWLKFGMWERVAHLQAVLPKYDWILYGDLDYIVKDMTRPLESFIQEFELYGKDEVHVLVPSDKNYVDTRVMEFSTFSVLIKNSPFGRKVLDNWREFAMGICPNGNFPSKDGRYTYSWEHSDQPGLWYALMKTHMDFYPNNKLPPSIVTCNPTTGLIDSDPWLKFSQYFAANKFRQGNYGQNLHSVPDKQPIIFSVSGDESRSGLGVDHNWVYSEITGRTFWKYAFALHHNKPKEEWDPNMQRELTVCQNVHGCAATFNEKTGEVQAGCHRPHEELA